MQQKALYDYKPLDSISKEISLLFFNHVFSMRCHTVWRNEYLPNLVSPNISSKKSYVSSVLEAAASNYFDVILDQILLSKKCVLLRLLFEGGFYLRAASNTEFTVLSIIPYTFLLSLVKTGTCFLQLAQSSAVLESFLLVYKSQG